MVLCITGTVIVGLAIPMMMMLNILVNQTDLLEKGVRIRREPEDQQNQHRASSKQHHVSRISAGYSGGNKIFHPAGANIEPVKVKFGAGE